MVGVLSFARGETQPPESKIGPHASIPFVNSITSLTRFRFRCVLPALRGLRAGAERETARPHARYFRHRHGWGLR